MLLLVLSVSASLRFLAAAAAASSLVLVVVLLDELDAESPDFEGLLLVSRELTESTRCLFRSFCCE